MTENGTQELESKVLFALQHPASQNLTCGSAGDGCGNVLQCGSCRNNDTCCGGGDQVPQRGKRCIADTANGTREGGS
jgi:hypothetical protein